jgi:hypothetical protein
VNGGESHQLVFVGVATRVVEAAFGHPDQPGGGVAPTPQDETLLINGFTALPMSFTGR